MNGKQPLDVTEIGRLHFLVGSRSRPDTCHLVDLESIESGGFTIPYFCSCEKFNENHYHHGDACHHLEAAVAYVQTNYYPLKMNDLTLPATRYRLFGRKLATGHDHLRPSLRPSLPFAMEPSTKEECQECALLVADQGFETCIVPDGEEPVFASDAEWDASHPAEQQAPTPIDGSVTGEN